MFIYDHTSSCLSRLAAGSDGSVTDFDTYLILVPLPHLLHNFLSLVFWDATLRRQDLGQDGVDLASHVGSVTTDVEVSLLL